MGHRPPVKGGYFPVPPVDSLQDIRSAICLALEQMGVEVEVHHHEVARRRPVRDRHQVRAAGAARRLDADPEVRRAQRRARPTARPRPSCRSRSSATTARACTCTSRSGRAARTCSPATATPACRSSRCTTSAASSSTRKALNAITNPGTNSYKRLVPGFEAPINLAYSARNRSAAVPHPVRDEPEGAPHRSALPRPDGEPVSRVRRDADGGPRRRAEQDPSRRSDRQEPVRPAAGRGRRRSRTCARRSTRRSSTSTRTASS